MIAYSKDNVYYSPNIHAKDKIPPSTILNDPEFSAVFNNGKSKRKEFAAPSNNTNNRYENVIVAAVPLHVTDNSNRGLFLFIGR